MKDSTLVRFLIELNSEEIPIKSTQIVTAILLFDRRGAIILTADTYYADVIQSALLFCTLEVTIDIQTSNSSVSVYNLMSSLTTRPSVTLTPWKGKVEVDI